MTQPDPITLTEQMLRRRPVIGAPVAHGASPTLRRSIGTFQLTMFGVGSTVGTGIFFVLSQAVPEAGPGVIISFLIAGFAAGLAAICYAELASAVPVSGSTYSYAYTTLGELMAMVVAACLLLEYVVATAAVAMVPLHPEVKALLLGPALVWTGVLAGELFDIGAGDVALGQRRFHSARGLFIQFAIEIGVHRLVSCKVRRRRRHTFLPI